MKIEHNLGTKYIISFVTVSLHTNIDIWNVRHYILKNYKQRKKLSPIFYTNFAI